MSAEKGSGTGSGPQGLDLVEWLKFTLEHGDETNRLLALEEISEGPTPPELSALIDIIAGKDSSDGCRALAARLRAASDIGAKAGQMTAKFQFTPEGLKSIINDISPELRKAILNSVRKPPPPEFMELWRNELLNENPPYLVEFALSLLARFGKSSDAGLGVTFLNAENREVVKAAINLLAGKNPEAFKPHLPRVLGSPDFEIQIHAVSKLRQIDQTEAVTYIRHFLQNPLPTVRRKALKILLLVPFADAESTYLEFISTETRSLLLVMAGLGVAFNPNPDLPIKIYDIFLSAAGTKKQILQLILNQTVDCINKAGILKEPVDSYVASLKVRLQKRRETVMVKLALKDLDNADSEIRQKSIQVLGPYAKHPVVLDSLKKRFTTETYPELKNAIKNLIGESETEPAPKAQEPAQLQILQNSVKALSFLGLPQEKQVSTLKAVVDKASFQQVREGLQTVILGNLCKPALLEVFRIIRDFGDEQEIYFILPFTDNPDPSIVAGAFKTCAGISPGSVMPILVKLLVHPDIEVKTIAYETALKLDKGKVLRHLSALFDSAGVEGRKQALLLVPLMDDSSVFPLLSRMFQSDSEEELKIGAGELLAGMPSIERLKLLYSGCHSPEGAIRKGFEPVWETARQNAMQILGLDQAAIEAQCKPAVRKMDQPKEANDYSFEKILAGKAQDAVTTATATTDIAPKTDFRQVPQKLDLDEWIMHFLHQSDETKKLLALEELRIGPVSPGIIPVLQKMASNDASGVVREIASGILHSENAREKAGKLARNFQFTPEAFKALIEGADPVTRQLLLKSIRKAPPKELMDLWRNQLSSETSKEVIEAGLHLLARFGEPSDANFASAFIGSGQPDVENAALDLLHSQNTELFKEHVGTLLESGDIRNQIHAVRRLRTVDPRDAMLFLCSLLENRDPMVRQKALRELLLIPFTEAEAVYLEFISVESQPLLLVMAGLGVAFNPHPELPLKIYDILLAARDLKKQILQLMLDQSIDCITQAGILKEPVDAYLSRLKGNLLKRREKLAIDLSLRELNSSDIETRQSAVRQLQSFAGLPEVVEALTKRHEIETDEEIKVLLSTLIHKEEAAAEKPDLSLIDPATFGKLPLKDQHRLLRAISTKEAFQVSAVTVMKLLVSDVPRQVTLELIEKAGRFGEKKDAMALSRFFQNHDPSIVAAAIKACGRLDIDSLLTTLTRFLQNEDPRIKAAALEIFLVADKEGAILYLSSMVRSVNPSVRRQTLKLLPLLDYAAAQPILLFMFNSEANLEIKLQTGYIIAANPTSEGMTAIFKASGNDQGAIKPEFADLWNSALDAAEPVLGKSRQVLEAELLQGVVKEKEAPKAQAQNYSYKKAARQKELASQGIVAEKKPFELPEFFLKHQKEIFIGMVLFLIVPLIGSFISGGSSSRPPALSNKQMALRNSQASDFETGKKNVPSFSIANIPAGSGGGGGGFSPGIKGAEDELKKIRDEMKVANKKALKEYIAEMAKQEANKGFADFYTNENCSNAVDNIEKGNYTEAKEYLLKALNDSTVSNEAKVMVCHNLIGVAYELGDKQTLGLALDKMFGMIPPGDVPKGYNAASVKSQLDQMSRMQEISPDQLKQVVGKMAGQCKAFSPEAQQKFMEGFAKMQAKFK